MACSIREKGGAIFEVLPWHGRQPAGIFLSAPAASGCLPLSVTPGGAAAAAFFSRAGSTLSFHCFISVLRRTSIFCST